MAKKVADIGGKRLVSLAPDAWVKWVTNNENVIAQELLGPDFQWLSRENDVLIKAFLPSVGEFLIANELQLRYNPKMPARIRVYAALAEEKYGLPVYPVLINILAPSSTPKIPHSFQSELLGLQARQDFRVINLWEVDVNTVFQAKLNPLLPFVPILRGGNSPELLQKALIELQQDDNLVELESLLGFFATFVLDTAIVQQILRWDMTVLRESPWYNEILEEGLKKGVEQGERAIISRQINRKYGVLSDEITHKIQVLSVAQLEALADALLEFQTIDDVKAWFNQQ